MTIDLDPQNPLTFQLMGYAYLHRAQQRPGVYPEDASMAVSNLERSVQLDPKYVWAAYNLSLAYWEIGEKEKAISTLRDLLEMEPSMRATIREDGQFDPLRASPEFQAEFGGDR